MRAARRVLPAAMGGAVSEVAELVDEITYPAFVKPARIQEVKHLMDGQGLDRKK